MAIIYCTTLYLYSQKYYLKIFHLKTYHHTLAELKNSGAISDDEYTAMKERIINGNENNRALTPLAADEKLDPKYAKEFSEEGF